MNVTECFDMATCGYDAGAGYAYDESDSYNCDDCHIGFDRETNLNYNYFRDYDPSTGRYVQSDPIGLAGGIHSFAYTNNPLSVINPLGLMGRAPGKQVPPDLTPCAYYQQICQQTGCRYYCNTAVLNQLASGVPLSIDKKP